MSQCDKYLNKVFDNLFKKHNLVCFVYNFFIAMRLLLLLVNLNKFWPLILRPNPVFHHVAWRGLPVPVPDRDAPGGAIVCHHVVKCFTWDTNF